MALSVPSNSFLLTTSPHSKLIGKHPKQLTIFAGNDGPFSSFRLRKPAGDSSSSSEDERKSGNNFTFNSFNFDWGKMSDVKSLIPVVSSPPLLAGPARRKDAGTVFVAGATGQVGVRVAQMLLREGFRVRAGVPDLDAAQELARFASDYKMISPDEAKRLNVVESMFEDAETIAKAIGNASKAVVTIGPTENGPTNAVTTSDAMEVVKAAQLAGVGHLAIVYDDESASSGSTNNVLDGISMFFNNLFSRSQPLSIEEFLEEVIQTDVRYTFIRTVLTDDFSAESSYNVVVATEGSASAAGNEYKVGRSQMAELVAGLFSNTEVAEDKVVEVYTDPSAPSKPLDELFSAIPEDGRRKAYAEALAKAKAGEEAIKAAEQAREAAEAKKRLEAEVKKLSEQEARASSLAEEAKQKAEEAGTSVDSLISEERESSSNDFGSGFSWEKLGSQFANAVKTPNIEIPKKVQIATVRGQAKAQSLPAQKAVVKQPNVKPKPKPKPKPEASSIVESVEEEKLKGKEGNREVRNILGGLFKQETIYVDDD